MERILAARIVCAVGAILAGGAFAADTVPLKGSGWTGLAHPQDVIAARQKLMGRIETLMEPIDTIQVKPVQDADLLRANAETISSMLLTFPHLFAPTTNLYDPKAELPRTLALPGIWKDFDTFYKFAGIASGAAEAMAATKDAAGLRAASARLRASCDACHAVFLRKYTGPQVQDSDSKFDFDSVLPK